MDPGLRCPGYPETLRRSDSRHRTFSVKRRTRYLQGRILLAEMMFYLYGLPTLPL